MVATGLNSEQSGVPASRHSKNRSKYGCRTCKVRRVKCDEGRPACQRCVKTGRKCDGYGIWGGGHQEQSLQMITDKMPLLRVDKRQPLLPLCESFTCTPQFRPDEAFHYDWFFCHIRPKLPGLSPSPFWNDMVIQAIHSESAVRHAMLAMTAAFRGAADLQRTYRGSNPVPDAEEVFMLKQYSQAFKELQPHFDPATRGRDSNRVILMTALIFVTLEFLRGNFTSGLQHLRNGLNVLTSGSDSSSPSYDGSPRGLLTYEDEQLEDAFYSLGGQLSYRDGGTTALPSVMDAPDPLKMPATFESAGDARKTLNKIISTTSALTRLAHERAAFGEHLYDWPSLVHQQRLTHRSFLTWYESSALLRDGTGKPVADQITAAMLRTNGAMAKIMIETSLSEDEMALDNHDEDFAVIIAGTRDILAARQTDEFKASKFDHGDDIAPFAVEGAFPQPLMYMSMKCRRPGLRREALDLIDAVPSRMAILDSRVVAKLARRFYEVEQRGCDENEAPPLERRVRLVDISWPDHPHGAMGFSYFARDDGVWKKRKAHLTLRD